MVSISRFDGARASKSRLRRAGGTWHNDYSCLPPFWTFRELSPSTCRESRERAWVRIAPRPRRDSDPEVSGAPEEGFKAEVEVLFPPFD